MDPEEFLALAERWLVPEVVDEPTRRSAVSRAYYAVYGVIAGEVERRVARMPRGAVHDLLVQFLRNSSSPGAEVLAETVGDLRDRRVEADYRLDRSGPTLAAARLCVGLARDAIVRFRALPQDQLFAGIRTYRKDVRKEQIP